MQIADCKMQSAKLDSRLIRSINLELSRSRAFRAREDIKKDKTIKQ